MDMTGASLQQLIASRCYGKKRRTTNKAWSRAKPRFQAWVQPADADDVCYGEQVLLRSPLCEIVLPGPLENEVDAEEATIKLN